MRSSRVGIRSAFCFGLPSTPLTNIYVTTKQGHIHSTSCSQHSTEPIGQMPSTGPIPKWETSPWQGRLEEALNPRQATSFASSAGNPTVPASLACLFLFRDLQATQTKSMKPKNKCLGGRSRQRGQDEGDNVTRDAELRFPWCLPKADR